MPRRTLRLRVGGLTLAVEAERPLNDGEYRACARIVKAGTHWNEGQNTRFLGIVTAASSGLFFLTACKTDNPQAEAPPAETPTAEKSSAQKSEAKPAEAKNQGTAKTPTERRRWRPGQQAEPRPTPQPTPEPGGQPPFGLPATGSASSDTGF